MISRERADMFAVALGIHSSRVKIKLCKPMNFERLIRFVLFRVVSLRFLLDMVLSLTRLREAITRIH